jgi:hypothetical protein
VWKWVKAKKEPPKISFLTSANRELNNRHITLKGVVIKEKRELWGIKKIE